MKPGAPSFLGGTGLPVHANPVQVTIKGQCAHNHVCGCTKCGSRKARCSQVAVVSRDNLKVSANESKLKVVDHRRDQRHACKDCGVHMCGRIENKGHPFYGFDFIHTELSKDNGWAHPSSQPVSSIIESGANPGQMGAVRRASRNCAWSLMIVCRLL
jgi:S-(hydroxymethyl)glutathione synthase